GGSASRFIPYFFRGPLLAAKVSVSSFLQYSPTALRLWPRFCRGTFCWARKKNGLPRSRIWRARFRAAVPAFCGSNFSAAITSESAASPCNLEIRCRQGAPSRRDLRFHCRGFPARALRLGKPAGVPPHGSRRELRQS